MRLIRFLVCLLALPASAFADSSQCSDILKQGVSRILNIRDNSYIQQIVYSRFARSDFQSASSNRDAGFGIPIGDIVLGGNYSDADFRKKQSEVQQSYFSHITASREFDVALTSGDPEIIGAWSQCMQRKGGGLSLRFEAIGGNDIIATLEWYSQGGTHKTKLTHAVVFDPGITVVAGDCFKKNKEIVAGIPCKARLKSNDASKHVLVTVSSTKGNTEAFLPKRLACIREVIKHPGESTRAVEGHGFRNHYQPQGALDLTDDQIRAGWLFDPKSTNARLYTVWTNGGGTICWDPWQKVEPHRFSFGYQCAGGKRNYHIYCAMDVSAKIWRDRWVPLDKLEATPVTGPLAGLNVNTTSNSSASAPLDGSSPSADSPTPSSGVTAAQEVEIPLKPPAEWPTGDDYAGLVAALPRDP